MVGHALAPRVEDARPAALGLRLVSPLPVVLVEGPVQRPKVVDGEGGRVVAAVVDEAREAGREAVGNVADVEVEVLGEAPRHLLERRDHVRIPRDHRAELVLRTHARVEGAHHVEVQLLHAVGRQEGRERADRLVVRADDAHVDGDALALAMQDLHRAEDAVERALLLGGPLVRLLGRALDGDAPGEETLAVPGGREDLVDERFACRLHAVREDDDLLEAEGDRVPDHVEESRLQRGLASQEGHLGVTVGAGLLPLGDLGAQVERTGAAEARLLAGEAEDATVVAHVTELDLDLLLRLHEANDTGGEGDGTCRSPSAVALQPPPPPLQPRPIRLRRRHPGDPREALLARGILDHPPRAVRTATTPRAHRATAAVGSTTAPFTAPLCTLVVGGPENWTAVRNDEEPSIERERHRRNMLLVDKETAR